MSTCVDRMIRKAKSLEREGRADQALAAYRAIHDRFPANPRAARGISRIRNAEAAQEQAAIQRLARLYDQGRMHDVLQPSGRLEPHSLKSAQLRALKGAAAAILGMNDIANAAFLEAVDLDPGSPANHANLGAALERRGAYEEAVGCYSAALLCAPDDAGYLRSHGNARRLAAKPELAIADFRASIAAEPANATSHHCLGLAYSQSGDVAAAVQALDHAVRLAPDDLALRLAAAGACQAAHDRDAAIAHLETALHRAPGLAAAHIALGTSFLQTAQTDKALLHLRQAVALDPGSVEARNNLGSALFAAAQYQEALQSGRMAVALKPDHATAHQNLANVHQHPGQLDLAVEAYGKAVALNPCSHAARAQKLHF